MTKRLLVTGLSGFVGSNLRTLMANQAFPDWSLVETPRYDITDAASVSEAVSAAKPDAVIHLAAQSFVPKSFQNPAATLRVNLMGTLNLLQSLKTNEFAGSFLFVSSGDVYGRVLESELPISESHYPKPRNPYAVSKLSAEALCCQWSFAEPDWRILVARPFNHIGIGQNDSFLVPEIAKQICSIRRQKQEPRLYLGDIDVTRDFLDVRDVISAYFALLERGKTGEIYNICSGKEVLVRDMVQVMLNLAGIQIEIVQDEARMRKAEQRRAMGSYAKLHGETGWHPTIGLEQSLKVLLDDWEQRLDL